MNPSQLCAHVLLGSYSVFFKELGCTFKTQEIFYKYPYFQILLKIWKIWLRQTHIPTGQLSARVES